MRFPVSSDRTTLAVDTAPATWTGRDDGPGPQHRRWHHQVTPLATRSDPGTVILGFASDEGVRRNQGRRGAARGPAALRSALGSFALPTEFPIYDAGDVVVDDGDLSRGQERLGRAVQTVRDEGHLPVVFGGGHEVAYGSYLGIADSEHRRWRPRLGVLNLDAHFDLRADPVPSSGTPFRQMLERELAAGRSIRYDVIGISQPSNTQVLFDTADHYGVGYLLDDDCGDDDTVDAFLSRFLDAVDLVYLTIDLDVLPAAVAPGVSAPAAYGVPLSTVQGVCDRVASSGKLALLDVAELNPDLDIDNRTARTAARLIHRIVTRHRRTQIG